MADDNVMSLEAIERLSELVEEAIASAGGQRPLSRRTGISQGTISKWFSLQVREWPLMGHLQALARYLGMSLGDFLDYLEHGGEAPESASVDDILNSIESQNDLSYEDAMKLNAAIAHKALKGNATKTLVR
jgi:transcriptional regulator with XRE-family HTH domain